MTHYYSSRKGTPIDTITVHCLVGQFTANRALGLFEGTRQASCNYVVGYDGSTAVCVPEQYSSWCSSSQANDRRAITVECASDTKHPYAVTDACYKALIQLLHDVMKRHGKKRLVWIPDKDKALAYKPKPDEMKMTVHRWFANKACPGDYLMTRMDQIAKEVTGTMDMPDEWAVTAWRAAYDAGVLDGTRPRDEITRQEIAVILDRLGLI